MIRRLILIACILAWLLSLVLWAASPWLSAGVNATWRWSRSRQQWARGYRDRAVLYADRGSMAVGITRYEYAPAKPLTSAPMRKWSFGPLSAGTGETWIDPPPPSPYYTTEYVVARYHILKWPDEFALILASIPLAVVLSVEAVRRRRVPGRPVKTGRLRWAWRACCATATVCMVATWIASYWLRLSAGASSVWSDAYRPPDRHLDLRAGTEAGGVQVEFRFTEPAHPTPTTMWAVAPGRSGAWRSFGYHFGETTTMGRRPPGSTQPVYEVVTRDALAFPTWVVVVLFSIPLITPLPAYWRRRTRLQRGMCLNCGYSLRGLPTPRCPECGCVASNWP